MSGFNPFLLNYIWDARNSPVNIRRCQASELPGYHDDSPHKLEFHGITTVFDVFANLFYWLDGQNVVEYESIYRLSADFVLKRNAIRQQVESLWKTYIREHELDASGLWTGPRPQFSPAMAATLASSFAPEYMRSNDDVLIAMMTWLKVLDRYFDNFYIYKRRNAYIAEQIWGRNDFLPGLEPGEDGDPGSYEEFRLPATVRGPLLFVHHNPIRETLHLKKVSDPDYTDIRKHARHVWLLPVTDRRYEVRHRSLYRHEEGRAANRIRIGFLTGSMDFAAILADMNDCFELANEHPTKLFTFFGLDSGHYAAYSSEVMDDLKGLLESGCDAILRPELSSPPELQERMQLHLKDCPAPEAKLVATGSFHIGDDKGPDRDIVYNSSLVLDGRGQVLERIHKSSRFIVHQTNLPTLEGFEFLKDRPAEEKIAIDRHGLTIFETNFGRVAIFICIDFLTDEVERILVERAVDVVFIMSMTDNPAGGKFLARMRHLGEKAGTIACICNQSFPVLQGQILGPNVIINLPVTTADGAVQPPFILNSPAAVIDISSRFRPLSSIGTGSRNSDFRDSRELSIAIPQDAFRGRENMVIALQNVKF